jgi:ubiquinone/menaquinone biosynthesis C-methylase UbiE
MSSEADLLAYYAARANEYEKVYAKPERQADLHDLQRRMPLYLADRNVLEIACGTGYWTRLLGARAKSVMATDASPEVLAVARVHQPAVHPVTFVVADAFALDDIPDTFDAAFVGFWWSHVRRADLGRFLTGLHRHLQPGSLVVVLDNRYVEGSSMPITHTDDEGNTYQTRQLERGTLHEVLKNFPSPDEVRATVHAAGGDRLRICSLDYYWYATYTVGTNL